MNSKILIRVLIVLLAALLIFRIHQRVETYRVPRDLCRQSMLIIAEANIQHIHENDGASAPSLDSLASYANLPDSILICPTLLAEGFEDSFYIFDPKLALGTQFAISCPNHDRHGGITGGLIEAEYPDSLFYECDWMETYFRYPFAEYAENRKVDVSRANLIRLCEEQMSYLASRYPHVFIPADPSIIGMSIEDFVDPLGGEYVFEILEDSAYAFYHYPERSGRARGDSVVIQTYRFVAYSTSDPVNNRINVYYRSPLNLPSVAEGAITGSNDHLVIEKIWDVNELGTQQRDSREVDLLDVPTWEFLQTYNQEGSD